MNTYTFTFIGREKGALGVRSYYERTVEAETYDAAVLKLYDTHEHISIRQVDANVPVSTCLEQPK